MKILQDALTFDDVLLVPRYSKVLPKDVSLDTYLTTDIRLSIPLISSAMDTVTESSMAIAMAQMGGLGIIHKNMTPSSQAKQVIAVKSFSSQDSNQSNYNLDIHGNLRVGAAIGTGDDSTIRIELLTKAGVDAIIIDTAHGHSKGVIDMVKYVRTNHPKLAIIAGNIATAKAAKALSLAGANAVKVGIGPGSICTTRIVAGVGVPQITAIANVAKALKNTDVKVIADGGIRFSGDISKAIVAGADVVMIGGLFAGTEESPGEIQSHQGESYKSYRGMGSIGAMSGINGSSDRYFQSEKKDEKLVPEGIEGRVPYKGHVTPIIEQLIGGIRSSMGYCGCKNISKMQTKPNFVRITNAGIKESHVHDVQIAKQSPNYKTH